MWFVFLIHPNIIRDNQNVRDKGRLIETWEVTENTWGYKAVKFMSRMNKKINRIMFSLPFSLLFSVNFTSFLNVRIIFLKNLFLAGEIFHMVEGRRIIDVMMIVQDNDSMEVLGSNTENRLFTIL
jgi:hypothetical protein